MLFLQPPVPLRPPPTYKYPIKKRQTSMFLQKHLISWCICIHVVRLLHALKQRVTAFPLMFIANEWVSHGTRKQDRWVEITKRKECLYTPICIVRPSYFLLVKSATNNCHCHCHHWHLQRVQNPNFSFIPSLVIHCTPTLLKRTGTSAHGLSKALKGMKGMVCPCCRGGWW